ncbi:MAG: TonB-dependent receptor, partial [Bacteroidetes bacterium]
KVTFVGYKPYVSEALALTRQAPRADLGDIRLVPDTAQLEGVEVTAEREAVTFAIDRTVYNVKDQPVSLGGSATDVLQNVPSVEVDGEGKVSLRGNQNVAILINGKPAPVRGDFLPAFLQQIPSSMIERVEVIPNPSAKYDPDGMAGILNIVLRQDAELGLGGGISLSAATGDKYNASGNLTYQKGRLTLAGSYGYRNDQRENGGYNFRENRYSTPLTFLEQNSDGLRKNTSHLVNLSADYGLSDRNTLSASAMLSTGDGRNRDRNVYEQLDDRSTMTGGFDRITTGDGNRFNMDYRLTFRRVVEPSTNELVAEVRFNREADDDFNTYTQHLFDEAGMPLDEPSLLQHNDLTSRENEWTFQVDYTRPLGGLKLETGLKSTLRRLDNDFFSETYDPDQKRFVPDVDLNNEFVYDEQVHAAYGILSGGVGRWEAQAGLRAEQALTDFNLETTGETFDNDYFSLFPSVFVAYKLADTRQVKLSYSKRIQRPRTRMLNPFPRLNDPLNLFVGNPRL